MTLLLKKFTFAIVCVTSVLFAASPAQQTSLDSMDGDWAVIDGKKRFLSGMNIAWISNNSFGKDVGDTKADMNLFTDKIKKIRKAGGNCVRWWLHTDAANCPKIDTTGAVTGLGSKTIANMQAALDTAYAYGVVVSMCLFSFDMLVPGDGDGKADYSDYNLNSNNLFLTEPANIDTYLEKGLKPILEAVGNHPAVMCWEVFNEPEGMLASANWSHVTKKLTQDNILRITNKIAGFVHRNSKKMASTGITGLEYRTEYSDSKLLAAGGDADGYLDFYMVHYYPEWKGTDVSPFHNDAAHWNMDRPILIGEFPAKSWSSGTTGPSSNQPLKTSKTITEAYSHAFEKGYAGAMSWCMSEPDSGSFLGNYFTTAPALEALFTAHKNDIMIKDAIIEEMSGDYVMKLVCTGLPTPDEEGGAYNELGTSFAGNFSAKSTLSFSYFIASGSGKNLQLPVVIKAGSDYKWCPAQDNALTLSSAEQGTWLTAEIPISAFEYEEAALTATDLSEIKEILFQFWALESAFTGTIYFDNVLLDADTLFNFNTEGTAWSCGAAEANVALVKIGEVTGVAGEFRTLKMVNQHKMNLTVQGRTVSLFTTEAHIPLYYAIYSPAGELIERSTIASSIAGKYSINMSRLSAGCYLMELNLGTHTERATILLR